MNMVYSQVSTPRSLIRRDTAWLVKSRLSSRAGELTLMKDRILFDTQTAATDEDFCISLKDVEKVKITQWGLLYQNIGIYTNGRCYVVQVRNARRWIDEICSASGAETDNPSAPAAIVAM